MRQHPANRARARLAQQAVDLMDEPAEPGIVDLLTSLRHLCDRLGLDFARLNNRSYSHYSEERARNPAPRERKS